MNAPKYHDGKRLVYEEIFRSPFAKKKQKEAENVLNSIRSLHDSAHGWVELDAWIEETEGGFVAVRHHAQYK